MNETNSDYTFSNEKLPMVALRGISVFPEMLINFDVERPASIASLNTSADGDRRIFLVAQKDILKENPQQGDLYQIGTVGVLRQFVRTQTGGMRVLIEGLYRAKLLCLYQQDEGLQAEIEALPIFEKPKMTTRLEALLRKTLDLYEQYTSLNGNSVPETLISLSMREDPGFVADYIAQNMFLKHAKKQVLLETADPVKRLKLVSKMVVKEIEVLSIEQQINEKLNEQLAHLQRDNVLREQMRVIQSELGDDDASELESYKSKIRSLKLPDETEKKLLKETERLAKQPFGSPEAAVQKGYLDTCLELPWNKTTKERLNIQSARKILDDDHFGLEKVKERIIEFLSVKQLAPEMRGTILCLVGPPGVGKTSIAFSIARALNRKLARMSLGGVRDEAEIRGHRKTYIGAMPGRIMNAMIQAGTKNPVILLDEIDKLGSDYRGDPSSALLEVLDPEQNASFRDHYIEVPFDLSDVLFITTANTIDTIPRPLLDRMEVIELASYTDEEKLEIVKRHLLPKQRKKHGLDGRQLQIRDDVIREIIAGYTKESGVRQLEREIASVCRKTAVKIAGGSGKRVQLKFDMLEEFLGVRKYKPEQVLKKNEIGVVNGLAWTAAGGELLEVEVNVLEGSGKLELTGNLGDVMKESAKAAVSYIRSRAKILGIESDFYKTKDIHIHFPEGAIPKDGPSAGITITIAVISALCNAPVHQDIAMTGEITLTGRILPIGGLREKTMAALRNGMHTVIIPKDNERDLEEIDQAVRRRLNFVTTSHIDSILHAVMDFPISKGQNLVEKNQQNQLFSDTVEHKNKSVGIRQ